MDPGNDWSKRQSMMSSVRAKFEEMFKEVFSDIQNRVRNGDIPLTRASINNEVVERLKSRTYKMYEDEDDQA